MSKIKLPQFKEPTTPSEVFTEWAKDLEQSDKSTGRDTTEMQGLFYSLAVAARLNSGYHYFTKDVFDALDAHVEILLKSPITRTQFNEAKIVKAWLLTCADVPNNWPNLVK